MTRQAKPSQNLAPLTSIKATVQGLRKVHSNARALSECFRPKSKGENTTREFKRASRALHKDLPAELDALQAALLDQASRGEL
jgi:hypothetical protein